jgi:hypothetical protein
MLWVDPQKALFRGVTEFSAPTSSLPSALSTMFDLRRCTIGAQH